MTDGRGGLTDGRGVILPPGAGVEPGLLDETTAERVLVRFRHVFKIYRIADTGVVALGGVDFDIAQGDFLAIVGPSGSGKSTILNMIGGLDRPTAGTVEIDGFDLGRLSEDELTEYRRSRVGFVWQGTARNLVPYLTARDNVRLPAVATGLTVPAERHSAEELLETVGMRERAGHRPGQLSGGEQQRVAVAVALANVPKLLLADEPTAELDTESAERVLEAFRKVNEEFGVTIVMVTHDLVAARMARRTLRLRDGRLIREGRPLDPPGEDGRLRLPLDALDALDSAGGGGLEFEVVGSEIRIRRKGEPGRA